MKGTRSIVVLVIFLVVIVGIIVGINGDGKLRNESFVVVTNFPAYDFARAVVGDEVDIKMLVKPGVEIHDYEPTPQDIIDIKNSTMFIYNGGESDEWIENILNDVEIDRTKTIKMMDIVQLLEEELTEGMEDNRLDGQVDGVEYDEHIWTSIKNTIKIIKHIEDRFVEIFPKNKEKFKQNTESYIHDLSVLDEKFEKMVDEADRKTVVFGDRFPLRYFVEDYGLGYLAVFPGCSEQTEASSKTISFLVEKIKAEKIPVIFKIEMSDGKVANSLAEETGAKVLEFHSAHNVSVEDFESGLTYVNIMENNFEVLKEALK